MLAIAIVALSLAAAPAWGQESPAATAADPAAGPETPQPEATGDTTTAPDTSASPAATPEPEARTPVETPPPSETAADPPSGEPAATGTSSNPVAEDRSGRRPSARADGNAASAPVPPPAGNAAEPGTPPGGTAEPDAVLPATDGYPGAWSGQDSFTLDEPAGGNGGAAAGSGGRFSGFFVLGAASHVSRLEAKARRSNETARASALGSGTGAGVQLPGQNPFFNMLSGPGGIAVSLMLASVLAVLGAAFVLPPQRRTAFRMPTVMRGPLAYVPPIELPG